LQYYAFKMNVKRFVAADQVVIDKERTVVITDSGVVEEGGKEESVNSYRWEAFYFAYETKRYFYLYLNTMQAVILPKRYFKKEEITFVEELIRKSMGIKFQRRWV